MLVQDKQTTEAATSTIVVVPRMADARRGDRLFKTGSKAEKTPPPAKLRRLLREETSIPRLTRSRAVGERDIPSRPRKGRSDKKTPTLYLRLSHFALLNAALDSGADWILLQATKSNLNSLSRRKMSSGKRSRLFWGLPAIIPQKDFEFYREQVRILQQRGHNQWLVANWAHFRLFSRPPAAIIADYTFNVLNSHSAFLLNDMGCQRVILSMENDRDNLIRLAPAVQRLTPLATVFGWPALFTSRLGVKPREGSVIWSSKKDRLQPSRQAELTEVRSDRPLCLFDHLLDLLKLGVRDFVVDLRGQKFQSHDLHKIMKGVERQKCPQPHSTFNYLGQLL